MDPDNQTRAEPCSANSQAGLSSTTGSDLARATPVRLIGTGAEQIIRQFEGSPLLTEGRLTIVALDAIAERLRDKWASRRSLVYDHCQRILRREFAADTLIQLVSETEFLVAHSSIPGAGGRLRCINCLRETLHHFLGEATDDAIRVSEVTDISTEGFLVRRVSQAQAEAAAASEASRAASKRTPSGNAPIWATFTASSGAELAVACNVRPLLRLNGLIQVGYRLAPILAEGKDFDVEVADLPPIESAKLHQIALSAGLDRLEELANRARPMTVVIPFGLSAFKSRSTRPSIVALLQRARALVRHGVLCEIGGLETATHWALQDALAYVKPFCLHTLARLSASASTPLESLRAAGVSAYTVRCPRIEDDQAFICWLLKAKQVCDGRTKGVLLDGVASKAQAHVALEFGFTHVTLAVTGCKPAERARDVPRAA